MKKRRMHTSIIPKKRSSIPTDEEFARASRLMRERMRGLDEISRQVIAHFGTTLPIHAFYLLPQSDVSFRGYLFLETDADTDAFKGSGLLAAVTDYIFTQFALAGRGDRPNTTLDIELDSHQNVNKTHHGNYFNRLR